MDEAIKAEFERLRDEDTRQNRRLEILEKNVAAQQQIAMSVQELALNMKQMLKEQEKQGARLDKLEREPADTWQRIKIKAIDTAVGLIAGAAITGVAVMAAQYIH